MSRLRATFGDSGKATTAIAFPERRVRTPFAAQTRYAFFPRSTRRRSRALTQSAVA